jgi:flagellar basal-body rod protein FlgC
MKVNDSFFGLKISAAGLSVQRKKMNLIAENIANVSTTKTEEGTPYKKKYLIITQEPQTFAQNLEMENQGMRMAVSDSSHFAMSPLPELTPDEKNNVEGLKSEEMTDSTPGDTVYMPDHPDADKDGYVHMPNVNTITEMVDMISASRSFEANLTALNTAKQMAKDALEI